MKDNENGTVEKDLSTANAETPTKSSKLSIFGSKDKNKDKTDKNALENSKMPLGLGGKPKTSDGFDGKCNYFLLSLFILTNLLFEIFDLTFY